MSNTENHTLWIDYEGYRFKIYIDIERKCLSGEVLINSERDTWFDSSKEIEGIRLSSENVAKLIKWLNGKDE